MTANTAPENLTAAGIASASRAYGARGRRCVRGSTDDGGGRGWSPKSRARKLEIVPKRGDYAPIETWLPVHYFRFSVVRKIPLENSIHTGKCDWLRDTAKIDAAFGYKNEDVGRRIREEFPAGVDLFFDNVGGDILDAMLPRMADNGRITVWGRICDAGARRADL